MLKSLECKFSFLLVALSTNTRYYPIFGLRDLIFSDRGFFGNQFLGTDWDIKFHNLKNIKFHSVRIITFYNLKDITFHNVNVIKFHYTEDIIFQGVSHSKRFTFLPFKIHIHENSVLIKFISNLMTKKLKTI